MSLSSDLLRTFKLSKLFQNDTNGKQISSLDIDHTGEWCVVSSTEDESIHLYDMIQGKLRKTLYSKKYGISKLKFTHRPSEIIYTSTKIDNTIRYLSMHDNQYLRYFRGHKNIVTALETSPVGDSFLSGSNESIRIWDIRSQNCQGLMAINSNSPQIAIDPQGLVFAVGLESRSIRMYDIRNYSQGPFATFSLEITPSTTNRNTSVLSNVRTEWGSLEFSPDGKEILISCKDSCLVLVDSYEGYVKERYEGNVNDDKTALQGCFTPDAKWVLCGGSDGSVSIWETNSCPPLESNNQYYSNGHSRKLPCSTLESLRDPVSKIMFNPKFMAFATISGCNLGFWIPEY